MESRKEAANIICVIFSRGKSGSAARPKRPKDGAEDREELAHLGAARALRLWRKPSAGLAAKTQAAAKKTRLNLQFALEKIYKL